MRVSPAAPTLKTPITVTARAGTSGLYGATITVRPVSKVRLVCSYGVRSKPRRTAAGATFTTTLKPAGTPRETRKWCAGPATITILRYPRGAGPGTVVARRRITIRLGPGELPPGPLSTPASIRLLAGSTISVASAGHPERSSALNGVLRGFIPSPFRLNQDIDITRARGALVPVALAADPLCPGSSPPRSLQATTATAMRIFKDGRVTMTVTFTGSTSQLSGCGPPGALTGTTAIALNGQVGARGLLALTLDGSTGGVTLKLLVLVDLSDRD